jgi:hypothetical protein
MLLNHSLVYVVTVVITSLLKFSQERNEQKEICIDRIHTGERPFENRDCLEYFESGKLSNEDNWKKFEEYRGNVAHWEHAIAFYRSIEQLQQAYSNYAWYKHAKMAHSHPDFYCEQDPKNKKKEKLLGCEETVCRFQKVVFYVVPNNMIHVVVKWVNETNSELKNEKRFPRLPAHQKYATYELFCNDYNILEEFVFQFEGVQLCPGRYGFDESDSLSTEACETENNITSRRRISNSRFERLLKCMAISRLPDSPLCKPQLRRHAMFWMYAKLLVNYLQYDYFAKAEKIVLALLDLEKNVSKMNRSTVWIGNGLVKPYRGKMRRFSEKNVKNESRAKDVDDLEHILYKILNLEIQVI